MRPIKFRCYNAKTLSYTYGVFPTTEKLKLSYLFYEQFTGLLDKNGVEIYEGDIQKCIQSCHYWIYVVKSIGGQFGNTLFSILIKDNMSIDDNDCYTFEERTIESSVRNYIRNGNNCEIIGNVNQSEELLK